MYSVYSRCLLRLLLRQQKSQRRLATNNRPSRRSTLWPYADPSISNVPEMGGNSQQEASVLLGGCASIGGLALALWCASPNQLERVRGSTAGPPLLCQRGENQCPQFGVMATPVPVYLQPAPPFFMQVLLHHQGPVGRAVANMPCVASRDASAVRRRHGHRLRAICESARKLPGPQRPRLLSGRVRRNGRHCRGLRPNVQRLQWRRY